MCLCVVHVRSRGQSELPQHHHTPRPVAPAQVIVPGSITSWDNLTLTAYTGWGVNAGQLTVRPQAQLPSGIAQRCVFVARVPAASLPPPAAAAASSDEDGSSSTPVGLIVGCTVGGVALLAALAAGAVLLRKRRQKRYTAGSR